MTSFMAQNYGAGEKKRIWKGFRWGMVMEVLYGLLIGVACIFGADFFMKLFVNDQEVIQLGRSYLHLIAFIYILPAVTNGVQGYFRGIGDLKVTLWSSIMNMGFRVLSALPLVYSLHMGIRALPVAYLLGWIAMLLFELPLLLKKIRENRKTE